MKAGKYDIEAESRWGGTAEYSEYKRKSAGRSEADLKAAADGLNDLFGRFAELMLKGAPSESPEALAMVGELRGHITENFYACDERMLGCLGEMYVSDPRFKANIDSHAQGTAEYVGRAIKAYCS